MSRGTVLHLLSQRPSLTGSGVTLERLVACAREAGWEQHVVVGVPADDPRPEVDGLPPERIHPLLFASSADTPSAREWPQPASAPPADKTGVKRASAPTDSAGDVGGGGTPGSGADSDGRDPGRTALDFPVPGMSDVMPYPSTVFSKMSGADWEAYESAWKRHLEALAGTVRPDVIHSHHLWVLSSMVKDVFPAVPVVTHCHATGLRQMELCGHRSHRIAGRLERNEAFVVLHEGDAERVVRWLDVEPARIRVVGAGYRDDLFHDRERAPTTVAAARTESFWSGEDDGIPDDEVTVASHRILYAGKYSAAKGLPWLLDAFERLTHHHSLDLELHVAGGGAGEEAERLRARMQALRPAVVLHGQLDQPALAELMRNCAVFVLPSLYEGLPLVLVEAAACGCRLVATELPGVVESLAPALGEVMHLVEPPRLERIDRPVATDVPAFVESLEEALADALAAATDDSAPTLPRGALDPFTWAAVFERVEGLWLELPGRDGSARLDL